MSAAAAQRCAAHAQGPAPHSSGRVASVGLHARHREGM
jgi:hypothetical protein